MDQYDVVDFIFEPLKTALAGFEGFKDKAKDGVTGKHFVVNALPWNENDDFINTGYVNVNLFVPLNANGMVDRQSMKTAIRAAKPVLKAITTNNEGKYRDCEIIWTETVDLKQGFDCKNIRILIKTDK